MGKKGTAMTQLYHFRKKNAVIVALIAGRHEDIPVKEAIFNAVSDRELFEFAKMERNMTRFLLEKQLVIRDPYGELVGSGRELFVYVTGLSICTAIVCKLCTRYKVPLSLLHYNKNTGLYCPQKIVA